MKMCCEPAQIWFSSAGFRGGSLLVKQFSGGFRFVMQYRSVDASEEQVLQNALMSLHSKSVQVNVSTQQVIAFCPFCGTKLDRILSAHDSAELDAIAEQHAAFLA